MVPVWKNCDEASSSPGINAGRYAHLDSRALVEEAAICDKKHSGLAVHNPQDPG